MPWKIPPVENLKKLAEKHNKSIQQAVKDEVDKEIEQNLNNKFLGYGHGILTRKSGADITHNGLRIGTSLWYGANWEKGKWKKGFKNLVAKYQDPEANVPRRKKGETDVKFRRRQERRLFFLEINKAQNRYKGKSKRPFISTVIRRLDIILKKAIRRKA